MIPENERSLLLWRTLGNIFSRELPGPEALTRVSVERLGLPREILESKISIHGLLERHPELEAKISHLTEGEVPPDVDSVLLYSKILINVFGPNAMQPTISGTCFQQWTEDVKWFEAACGKGAGALRGGRSSDIDDLDLQRAIQALEKDLIKRMALREILEDDVLTAQVQPSIGVIEQLLRDKSNLSGKALLNAKALIRKYVDELADVLKTSVQRTPAGKADRSIPPKRIFRNLDLKRTLWKNLPNYNPDDGRLYVDQLFYRRHTKKIAPKRLIVVVDQSGSMVEAMVQCTILASIFAGLRHVDVHLLAFDTRVLDLTPWVSDPFEVLLRTELGGGTLIRYALTQAETKIEDPANTVVVLISDFYEGGSDQELLDTILAIKASGATFIPVGAITGAGAISIHPWFRTKLQEAGMPILSGKIEKLISNLKANL